ncbi:MAG TPA: VWA domain-containing protein [Pyrinomonadaceae bacterium]|jgi:VWFA-related protein|nr:VWA domain-containing protein [Pyrinomonadaceae bacterium]
MNSQLFQTIQTMSQGRESEDAQRRYALARPLRSLNSRPWQSRSLGFGFAPLRLCLNVVLFVIVLAVSSVSAAAQEVEDTIRIKTRVVFLDALVKDKKTNLPISNLDQANFEVLDDGKPRSISYFIREGEARKPLALILIMDLREDGAGRFMKKPEIIKSMEQELAKLPAGDEVAIMAMDIGEGERRVWLTQFTNDRTKIATALAEAQRICATHDEPSEEGVARNQNIGEDIEKAATVIAEASASQPAGDSKTSETAKHEGDPKDIVSTEVIKGKSGATITRTIRRDGSIDVKRVSKDGKMTVQFNDIYDMASAIQVAALKAKQIRPNSQVSVVWISDGIAPIFFEDREASEQALIHDNIIFNSLTVELRTLFKFLMPIGKPIAGWMGLSLYGSAKYLAQRSGGEAVKVNSTKDYGSGLARIIGNLTARYSLGFALTEDEIDDGRMHALQVRVKAKDQKGKDRKLLVSSRQGYYMSTIAPKDAAAKAQ